MASAPKTYPYQDITTVVKQDPFFQQMVWGGANSPGRLLMNDASRRGRMIAGVQQGDPKALGQFFGYKPTQTDYASLGLQEGANGSFIRKFDPASGQYRNVANPDYKPQAIPTVALRPDIPTMPTQQAAQGGIMSLRGFAAGGSAPKKTPPAPAPKPTPLTRPTADPKTALTTAEQKKLDQLNALRNSNKPMTQAQIKQYNDLNGQYQQYQQNAAKPDPNGAVNKAPYQPIDALNPTTPFVDQNGMSTNPYYNNAVNTIANNTMPQQFQQASDMFNKSSQGLQSLANYKPSQVSATSVNPYEVSAQNASAQQGAASTMGSVADISAQQANADKMGSVADVQAKPLTYFQMEGKTPHVSTQGLTAYQMNGPGSWTDEGVQQKYMNPYIQGVIDVSKRQKARDYAQQVNDLNGNAAGVGAFGGARQALQISNAARDYQQQLQDLEAQGLSQAYQQGQGQWTTEMQAAQQAAMQNLQSQLSTQSQSSSQDLQAQLANQGIDYNTAVQNLQAKLGVQATEADQMLRAALANQQTQFGVGQTNAQLGTQTNLANMQAALEAAKANQQTQFGVGQTNAQLGTQASLTNAQLGTQASLANAQNALQASLGNQSNSLAAQQANQQAAINAMIANQNAGLSANQQGIGAYGQMGQNASGLGGIANGIVGYKQQQIQNWGNAGNILQTNAQNQANNRYIGANNLYGGVPNAVLPGIQAAQTNPQGGTTNQNTQIPAPLSR